MEDNEGMDFPDLEAAVQEAKESARELLAEAIKDGRKIDAKRLEIIDEERALLASVWLRDLID